jgi:hypothetical protein
MSKDSGSSGPDEGDLRRRQATSELLAELLSEEVAEFVATGPTPEQLKDSINEAARAAFEKNMTSLREQHNDEMQRLRDELAATLLAANVAPVPDVPPSAPSKTTSSVPPSAGAPPSQDADPPIHTVSFSPLVDT